MNTSCLSESLYGAQRACMGHREPALARAVQVVATSWPARRVHRVDLRRRRPLAHAAQLTEYGVMPRVLDIACKYAAPKGSHPRRNRARSSRMPSRRIHPARRSWPVGCSGACVRQRVCLCLCSCSSPGLRRALLLGLLLGLVALVVTVDEGWGKGRAHGHGRRAES